MILTMTKYHGNLLRDGPMSLLFIVKFFSPLETKTVLKIPNETFLKNHPILSMSRSPCLAAHASQPVILVHASQPMPQSPRLDASTLQ